MVWIYMFKGWCLKHTKILSLPPNFWLSSASHYVNKYMNILFINKIMLLVLLNIRICPFNLHYNQIFRSKIINSHFLLLIYHRNKHRSMLFNWFVNCIVYFYNCLNVLSPYFIYVCFSCVFPQGIVGSSYFHLSYYCCYLRATPLKTSLFVQLLWNTQ